MTTIGRYPKSRSKETSERSLANASSRLSHRSPKQKPKIMGTSNQTKTAKQREQIYVATDKTNS